MKVYMPLNKETNIYMCIYIYVLLDQYPLGILTVVHEDIDARL